MDNFQNIHYQEVNPILAETTPIVVNNNPRNRTAQKTNRNAKRILGGIIMAPGICLGIIAGAISTATFTQNSITLDFVIGGLGLAGTILIFTGAVITCC